MKNKQHDIRNTIKIMMNVFFETLTSIVTLYLVSCFLISFQGNLVKILLSCLNINIIMNFKSNIEKEIGKMGSYIILAISIIILIFFVYSFGYFKISANFTKL